MSVVAPVRGPVGIGACQGSTKLLVNDILVTSLDIHWEEILRDRGLSSNGDLTEVYT